MSKKPKMCTPQPVQLDCRVTNCKNYKGSGTYSHDFPEIVLNENNKFTCYSHRE